MNPSSDNGENYPSPYTPTQPNPDQQILERGTSNAPIRLSDGVLNQHFTLLRDLGVGGMGVVSLAWQEELRRYVAIKRALHDTAALQSVLYREAQIMAQLDHPNIVPMHMLFQHEQLGHCMVMKFVSGVSWKELIIDPHQHTPPILNPADRLLRHIDILIQVCNPLRFAHSKGILHRDMKPENIMVGQFGEIYIMDWGLAAELSSRPITEEIIGTLAYLPPEMATPGAPHSQATDIYMLGGCLLELLLLRTPHAIENTADVLMSAEQIRKNILPDFPMNIPPQLAEICRRACHTDAAKRYQTAEEFQQDLIRFVRGYNAQMRLETVRTDLERLSTLPPSEHQRAEVERAGFRIQQAQDMAGEHTFILRESWALEELRLIRLLELGDTNYVQQQLKKIRDQGGDLPLLELKLKENLRQQTAPVPLQESLRRTARGRAFGIGFFSFCLIIITAQIRYRWIYENIPFDYPMMVGSHIGMTFIMGIVSWIQRRVWLDNPVGRINTIVAGSCMLLVLMNRLWGWRIGAPPEAVLGTDLLLIGYGICANLTVSLRFWSMPLPFLLGWLGMMLLPAYTVDLFFLTLTIGTTWTGIVFLRDDPPGRIGQNFLDPGAGKQKP